MYLVAYDITDDSERRHIRRVLDGYGHSVQRSVHLCHIQAAQARRMLAALDALNIQTGFLLCWKISDATLPESRGRCPQNLYLQPERVLII